MGRGTSKVGGGGTIQIDVNYLKSRVDTMSGAEAKRAASDVESSGAFYRSDKRKSAKTFLNTVFSTIISSGDSRELENFIRSVVPKYNFRNYNTLDVAEAQRIGKEVRAIVRQILD